MKKLMMMLLAGLALQLSAQPLWMRYNVISPQGDKIAFCYKGDVYVVDARGGKAQQLTTTPSYETMPVWSPDGKTLAFVSDRNGNYDVYTVPAEGGTAHRVTTNSAGEMPLAFSPDGKEIYYTAQLQKSAQNAQFATGCRSDALTVRSVMSSLPLGCSSGCQLNPFILRWSSLNWASG